MSFKFGNPANGHAVCIHTETNHADDKQAMTMAKQCKSKFAVLVAVMSLASCGAVNNVSNIGSPTESATVTDSANILTTQHNQMAADSVEANVSQLAEPSQDVSVSAGQPQLIKQAQLSLMVDSVDDSLNSASQLVRTYQADILDLQDNQMDAMQRTAYLRIRVPQAKLDSLLDAIGKLGTIQQQGLSAEDVSTQIVDAQARLRNLRKSEESLLKIMERAGEISHVLDVSRELSRVRENIEQIDARVQNLKNQVRYSTIDLTLTAAVVPQPVGLPLNETIRMTWQDATHSVGDLTVGVMQMGLWLLAYSPYLLIVAIAGGLGYRTLRRRSAD
ncbi:MAG: DUF4349 domain-containing protein [Cyanobacteria bacterium J06642_11]